LAIFGEQNPEIEKSVFLYRVTMLDMHSRLRATIHRLGIVCNGHHNLARNWMRPLRCRFTQRGTHAAIWD